MKGFQHDGLENNSLCSLAGQLVSPQSAPSCIEHKNDVSRENSTLDVTKVSDAEENHRN